MSMSFYFALIALALAAIALIVIIAVLFIQAINRRKVLEVESIYTKSTKRIKKDNSAVIYQNLSNIPILRRYTRQIYSAFEVYHPSDEKTVMKLTVKTVMTVITIAVVLVALVIAINPSLYLLVCCILTIYAAADQLLLNMTEKIDSQLMDELDNFLELLQFNYLQVGSIEDALHDSLIGKNKLVEKHASQILKIITSDTVDDDLVVYNTSVKNKFLRELLCICLTVYQYGDPEVEGQSAFLKNLRNLKSRIGDECVSKMSLIGHYKFLPIVCIIPMYFGYVIEQWAISNFQTLEPYYKGYYGFTATIVCFACCLVSYIIIGRNRSEGTIDYSEHTLLNNISKIPVVHKYLSSYYNTNYGKKLQLTKLLKQVGSKLNVYTLAIKRFLLAAAAMLATFVLLIGMMFYTKSTIRSSITGTGSKSSAADEEESLTMLLMIRGYTDYYLAQDLKTLYEAETGNKFPGYSDEAFEKYLTDRLNNDILLGDVITISDSQALEVIQQYNEEYSASTAMYTAYLGTKDGAIREYDESMYTLALKQMESLKTLAVGENPLSLGIFTENVIDDVVNAIVKYNNTCWQWYYTLLGIVVAMIAYMIPYLSLIMARSASQQQLETEVMQFQSIIMILMPIKSMSAAVILDWMLTFSDAFHHGIHKCMVNLSSNESKAYEDLIDEEPFEPFRDIVRKLEMCDKVGVQKAFFNMDVIRKNFEERNKQVATDSRAKRLSLSNAISFIPVYASIIAFMVAPIVMEAFGQLSTTMYQLNNI